MRSTLLTIAFFTFCLNSNSQVVKPLKQEDPFKHDAALLNLTETQLVEQMQANSLKRVAESKSNSFAKTTASVNPACTNMDFETGNTTGWTINTNTTLILGNSCNPGGFSNVATTYSVLSNGYIDPYMPTMPINSQFGPTTNGTKFLKLNDHTPGGNMQQLTQSFSVTTSNNLFKYAYMFVTYANAGHGCCDDAFFNIRFLNSSNQTINFLTPTFSISSSSICNTTYTQTTAGMTVCPGNANFAYTPWIQGAVDLTPFIGSFVTFELTVSDCSSAGHSSYCYFDAACAPITFQMNGNPTQLDSTNNICAANLPMTLVAPNGFQSYAWAGPNTSLTQTLNATSYGTYTLTLTGLATCCPIKKIFNISPCTGISEKGFKSNDVFIFPNPSKDLIRIENITDKTEYELLDILGKQVIKRDDLPENKTISIADYPKGIYFIRLYDSRSQVKTYKIIKE